MALNIAGYQSPSLWFGWHDFTSHNDYILRYPRLFLLRGLIFQVFDYIHNISIYIFYPYQFLLSLKSLNYVTTLGTPKLWFVTTPFYLLVFEVCPFFASYCVASDGFHPSFQLSFFVSDHINFSSCISWRNSGLRIWF